MYKLFEDILYKSKSYSRREYAIHTEDKNFDNIFETIVKLSGDYIYILIL